MLKLFIFIIGTAFLLPLPAYAFTAEEELDQLLPIYIQAKRSSTEPMESTSLQSKELTGLFQEISYPVTWVFGGKRLPTVSMYGMSKDLARYLHEKMLFGATREANGALNLHTPLSPHVSPRFMRPILVEDAMTSFEYATFTPLLTTQIDSFPLYRAQFVVSDLSGEVVASRKTTLRRYDSLADIEKGLLGSLRLSDSIRFGEDSFAPSVMHPVVQDAVLAGVPAKELTMQYERMGRIYAYKGLCTMRERKVACAEMSARAEDFTNLQPTFDAMLASLVFKSGEVTPPQQKIDTAKKSPSRLRREARERKMKQG